MSRGRLIAMKSYLERRPVVLLGGQLALRVLEPRFDDRRGIHWQLVRRRARAEGERVLVVAFAAMPAQRHGAGTGRESLRGKSREARLASARRPQDRVSPRANDATFRRSRVCSMAWRGNGRDALV